MAKPNEATQIEVPGTPLPDLALAVQRTNDAVALVQEAEANLRRARAAERLARAQEAQARASR